MPQPIPASTEAQIAAILNGRVEELFAKYGLGQEALVDLHLYVTITRSQLHQYFAEHPGTALAYFATHHATATEIHHDMIVLQKTESTYAVWCSDHGIPRSLKTFTRLEEAVAEYILGVTGRLLHGDK